MAGDLCATGKTINTRPSRSSCKSFLAHTPLSVRIRSSVSSRYPISVAHGITAARARNTNDERSVNKKNRMDEKNKYVILHPNTNAKPQTLRRTT